MNKLGHRKQHFSYRLPEVKRFGVDDRAVNIIDEGYGHVYFHNQGNFTNINVENCNE